MTDSDKARTNKKWTSTEKYRDNYDRIFAGEKITAEDIMAELMDCEPNEVRDKIRESPVWDQFKRPGR